MTWGLTIFLVGLFFGWGNPGPEDRVHLLKLGTLLAVILAFGYAMIGVAVASEPLLLGPGYVAGLFTFFLLVFLFLAGTWAGDWLDRRTRRPVHPHSTGTKGRSRDG